MNYLRVCDNPLQDIPLTGVLHSPLVGCTAQDLSLIRLESPEGLLYESLCAFIEKEPGEEGEAENCEEQEKRNLRNKLKKFHRQLQEIRDMAAYTPVHQHPVYSESNRLRNVCKSSSRRKSERSQPSDAGGKSNGL